MPMDRGFSDGPKGSDFRMINDLGSSNGSAVAVMRAPSSVKKIPRLNYSGLLGWNLLD